MHRLTPAQLASRLAFDWQVKQEMAWPKECAVTGYVSAEAAARGRAAADAEGRAGLVTLYDADIRFRMLSGPTTALDHARVRIDLLAGGNYPFSTPVAQVLSRPPPYSTHVAPGIHTLCLGEGWGKARGKILAMQLVVHCMKCFNYDEPDRGPLYGGYLPEAHRFWREKLGCKPLNPGLPYPGLPLHLTHGIVDVALLFEDIGLAAPKGAPLFEDVDGGGNAFGFEVIP